MYRLILYEAGDLVNPATHQVRPEVLIYFNQARLKEGPARAIITNQAGPACGDAGWKTNKKYPTLEEVELRYQDLAETLHVPLYMSLAYILQDGQVILPKGIKPNDPRANPSWRMPSGGMILQAMQDFEIFNRRDVLVVGTLPEAMRAAKAVGVNFVLGLTYFQQKTTGHQKWIAA